MCREAFRHIRKARCGNEAARYRKRKCSSFSTVGELTDAVTACLDTGTAPPPKPEPEPAEVVLNNDQADVVLASFSEAIDAVDRDDVAEAKEKLQTVQKMDETNEIGENIGIGAGLVVSMPEFTLKDTADTDGFFI